MKQRERDTAIRNLEREIKTIRAKIKNLVSRKCTHQAEKARLIAEDQDIPKFEAYE